MCEGTYGDQMNMSETMELELQVAVHYSTYVPMNQTQILCKRKKHS